MHAPFPIEIFPQPDDLTCGPTSLHAVYRYYGDDIALNQVVEEVHYLEEGGTLGVLLANHAVKRGYRAHILTCNLHVFDPTWMTLTVADLLGKLAARRQAVHDRKLRRAIDAYTQFLQSGGQVGFRDMNPALIRGILRKGVPILTGLSATWLYQCAREVGTEYDDVRGHASGHFVVLAGYDEQTKTVRVADPLFKNPAYDSHHYDVAMDRLINAILLGILTYDANLILIEPPV
jgi:hypothetical protein